MVPTFNQDSTEFPSLPHKSTIHSDIKKKITYFFFNLNRLNSDQDIDTLSLQLDFLISFSKKMYQDTSNVYEKKAFLYYLLILYKLIAHTRDISHGKGERKLTYMMIYSWYKFLPIPALFALKNIIYNSDSTPMGSWKDIKYFCHYVKDHSYIGCEDPLIISVLEIMNKQLYQDFIKMNDPNYKISTVAKWVPRENTKFGWVFYKLVLHWFTSYEPLFLSTPKNEEQYIRAFCKCCRQYRIMISKMNRLLGTVEIKQCANDWSNIETTHVNTYSLLGKQNVFFSKNELPSAINPEIREKKVKCIRKFKQYFQDIIDSSGNSCKNKIPIHNYIKKAFGGNNALLDHQWKTLVLGSNKIKVKNVIPLVDVSFSMNDCDKNSLYNALGLGIYISKKSTLGSRFMAIDNEPSWIKCDQDSITDIIQDFNKHTPQNTFANYIGAFKMVLESIIETNLSLKQIENLVFVILSDFKFCIDHGHEQFYEKIKGLFQDAFSVYGEKATSPFRVNSSHKTPFPMPHIVFWNISNSIVEILPCNINTPKTTFLSGANIDYIRYISRIGIDGWICTTPFDTIVKILNNPRYKFMEDLFNNITRELG